MRLNQFIAHNTGLSRRGADAAIDEGRVTVNGRLPQNGVQVDSQDIVTLDGTPITPNVNVQTIMLNKPTGYVCSRNGQGSKTVYDLLPPELHHLKSVGRLDKDSSGLLLLTNDGELANRLTHPRYQKTKVYEITLNRDLTDKDFQRITRHGVTLDDGVSKLGLNSLNDTGTRWKVTMHEGRNRQIRRTFANLGYHVDRLHRTVFGSYELAKLESGHYHNVR